MLRRRKRFEKRFDVGYRSAVPHHCRVLPVEEEELLNKGTKGTTKAMKISAMVETSAQHILTPHRAGTCLSMLIESEIVELLQQHVSS